MQTTTQQSETKTHYSTPVLSPITKWQQKRPTTLYLLIACTKAHTQAHIHTHPYTYTHTHICTHMHTLIHTHTRTHTHRETTLHSTQQRPLHSSQKPKHITTRQRSHQHQSCIKIAPQHCICMHAWKHTHTQTTNLHTHTKTKKSPRTHTQSARTWTPVKQIGEQAEKTQTVWGQELLKVISSLERLDR